MTLTKYFFISLLLFFTFFIPYSYSISKIYLDLNISDDEINNLVLERIKVLPVVPNLVIAQELNDISVYKRFQNFEKKQTFRINLLQKFSSFWQKKYGIEKASKFMHLLTDLITSFEENGALVFGSILGKEDFQILIDHYTQIFHEADNKNWIHTYVNLANHPNFLISKEFKLACMHPILIAMISYQIGSPIRIVDVRAKDTKPVSILAQDNMLHIDNTPFNDEYKIILTWELGKPTGPKGQNFVFLPGTHKGVRQCMMTEKGTWSSENASIFITQESIEKLFAFQEKVIGKRSIVELTHHEKPLTTAFSAGALVHHRYRTKKGTSRSCIITAFQRIEDNPGELFDQKYLKKDEIISQGLSNFLFSPPLTELTTTFLDLLIEEIEEIENFLKQLINQDSDLENISIQEKELQEETLFWIENSLNSPTIQEKKIEKNVFFPLYKEISKDQFLDIIIKEIQFDKHGPLDLILYPDGHEEIRKWARNQIREKHSTLLANQLVQDWSPHIIQPDKTHLYRPDALQSITNKLVILLDEKVEKGFSLIHLPIEEKISSFNAYRSLRQLLLDLGEAIVRCENLPTFVTTSLFIFWATDTFIRFFPEDIELEVKELGEKLLANYIATTILLEKNYLHKEQM